MCAHITVHNSAYWFSSFYDISRTGKQVTMRTWMMPLGMSGWFHSTTTLLALIGRALMFTGALPGATQREILKEKLQRILKKTLRLSLNMHNLRPKLSQQLDHC